jgi:hypothetical protein
MKNQKNKKPKFQIPLPKQKLEFLKNNDLHILKKRMQKLNKMNVDYQTDPLCITLAKRLISNTEPVNSNCSFANLLNDFDKQFNWKNYNEMIKQRLWGDSEPIIIGKAGKPREGTLLGYDSDGFPILKMPKWDELNYKPEKPNKQKLNLN